MDFIKKVCLQNMLPDELYKFKSMTTTQLNIHASQKTMLFPCNQALFTK